MCSCKVYCMQYTIDNSLLSIASLRLRIGNCLSLVNDVKTFGDYSFCPTCRR